MTAPARFYDGETAQAHAASVRATAGELIILRAADGGALVRWPIAELAVLGDLTHEAVPLLMRRGSDARLVIVDPALRRQLADLVPGLAALAAQPTATTRRIVGFGTTLVALIGLFWLAIDYGTQYAVPLLPHGLQVKLGESVFEALTANETLCEGEKGVEALNRLANRMARAADYPHDVVVYVVNGGPVNAFTLPGGILVFYSDLIEQAKDRAQVAGIMAHEIGHVVHHHPVKGVVRQLGVDLLVRLVSGGYSDVVSTLGAGGNLLLGLRNGRAFERDADATGVRILEKLEMRADGIASFFEQMLEKEPKDAAAAIGIWSSHPPTGERIAATRRPATGRPPFTDAEWKAVREVCK